MTKHLHGLPQREAVGLVCAKTRIPIHANVVMVVCGHKE